MHALNLPRGCIVPAVAGVFYQSHSCTIQPFGGTTSGVLQTPKTVLEGTDAQLTFAESGLEGAGCRCPDRDPKHQGCKYCGYGLLTVRRLKGRSKGQGHICYWLGKIFICLYAGPRLPVEGGIQSSETFSMRVESLAGRWDGKQGARGGKWMGTVFTLLSCQVSGTGVGRLASVGLVCTPLAYSVIIHMLYFYSALNEKVA